MHPKEADAMANSVDPDQTASSEAVWSWSALFAETYLSQYIEFLRYNELDTEESQWLFEICFPNERQLYCIHLILKQHKPQQCNTILQLHILNTPCLLI